MTNRSRRSLRLTLEELCVKLHIPTLFANEGLKCAKAPIRIPTNLEILTWLMNIYLLGSTFLNLFVGILSTWEQFFSPMTFNKPPHTIWSFMWSSSIPLSKERMVTRKNIPVVFSSLLHTIVGCFNFYDPKDIVLTFTRDYLSLFYSDRSSIILFWQTPDDFMFTTKGKPLDRNELTCVCLNWLLSNQT